MSGFISSVGFILYWIAAGLGALVAIVIFVGLLQLIAGLLVALMRAKGDGP